ncbi:PepSY domain-containing protein [Ancylobacter polymorphus]|uniref:PepSY domain-containing protein n=1 Tax=Ancylobacter polymorphus TaxID=223390 RepID=A0A9E7D7Z9_9HYPH|nr:PepSY domain-containing protein [Ancylobacter polymorphus]UOK72831.1 PepSY domain-containing protein [Ancylobacter polymorphus]
MKKIIAGLVAVSVLAPAAAFAGPVCTTEAKDKWMSEDAMKAKVAEMGYQKIKTFKVSGSCYEIYGYTKDNKKAEVYFNPVTGAVVKAEID